MSVNHRLDLVRLRINRRDSAQAWADLIRQAFLASGGRRERARQLADLITYDFADEGVYGFHA